MANAAWVAELSKVENDALRQSGDIAGLVAKYNANTGARQWNDAPQGEFLDTVNGAEGGDWLAGLSNAQANTFRSAPITVNGQVTLSVPQTVTDLNALLSAAQDTAVAQQFSFFDKYYETLGLPNLGRRGIVSAMKAITDTPQYAQTQKRVLVDRIRAKGKDNALLRSTSLANLQTIDSLIGT
jgi:hypothetical protein